MLKLEQTMRPSMNALKWTEDGELSAVDMARVLDALNNKKLVKCKVSCDPQAKTQKEKTHEWRSR